MSQADGGISKFALGVVIICTTCSCATAPSRSVPAGATPAVLALKPYVAGLRVVDVRIAGRTGPFLFDTGGGVTLVTPSVATAMGCQPFGQLTGFRNDGQRLDMTRCGATTLSIGPWQTRVDGVGVFDLMALLPGLPEIGGLVALSTFAGHALTIDLGGNRVTVETPRSLVERVRGMKEIRVRESGQAGGASLDLFVAVETSKGPIWLELDTGNTTGAVLLSQPALRQLGLTLEPDRISETTLSISGYGPVHVGAMRKDSIYDGLLDRKFMESFVITIDLQAMRAWMAPRAASDPIVGRAEKK